MQSCVDVIVPAYNGSRVIGKAIESALAQEGVARLIVVDDGSTDESANIARTYGPKITVVVQQNRGVAGARNTGLRASTAPFVALLDQDNVWQPGKLERQIRILQTKADVGLVFTDVRVVALDGSVIENGFLRATHGYVGLSREPLGQSAHRLSQAVGQALVRSNFIAPSSVLLRRVALERVGGFDESFRLIDDADCWMRLLQEWRAAVIEAPLVHSLAWEQNASIVHADKLLEERLKLRRKIELAARLFPPGALDYLRVEESVTMYRLGVLALAREDIAAARHWFLSSLRSRPRPQALIGLGATCLGRHTRNALLQLKRVAGLRWGIQIDW